MEQYELDPELEEYTHTGTFTKIEKIESKQATGFRFSVLSFFDEQANVDSLSGPLSS